MPKVMSQYDLSKIPVKGLVAESGATAPSAPVGGQLWYDTSVNKLKAYQNGAWVTLDLDTNTSYTTGTTAQIATGTDNTAQVWAASALKTAIVANSPVASVSGRTGVVTLTKTDVGLSNVDNTSDANKPVSTAQQTALNAKANSASPTFTGTVTVPTPAIGVAAANKDYVDSVVQGIDAKASVRVATTGNILLGTLPSTLDGVTLANGDRVLVKNQTAPAENGIYTHASGALTRATDMDSWAEVPGAFVFVEDGTQNSDTGWLCSSNAGGTLGTTAINWTQFSSAGIITAGSGLTKTGNVLSVATGGISSAMMGYESVVLSSTSVTGVLDVDHGGTGVNNVPDLKVSLQIPKNEFLILPALAAGTWVTIPDVGSFDNGLVVRMPHIVFMEVSTGSTVVLDTRIDSGNLQVKADVSLLASTITATISGGPTEYGLN